jgi:DNA-binding transcriptional ArsR family regulator
MKLIEERTSQLDRTLTALADPTRRSILQRLMKKGESRVTDLARPYRMSLNAVSKHIRVLERARLIHRRRVWREHWVSYNAAPLDAAAKWIEEHRVLWTQRLQKLDDLLQEEDRENQKRKPK